jgi:protein TonB
MNAIAQSLASPADRLGLTLFLAAALHGIVILGVSFVAPLSELRTPPALDVIIVQQQTEEAPDEADYLAQQDLLGSGSSEDKHRTQTPFASDEITPTDGIAPQPMEAATPEPAPAAQEKVISQRYADEQVPDTTEQKPSDTPAQKLSPNVIEQSLEIARLSAEISDRLDRYAKRPRKTFLTAANTKRATYAAYMQQWVEKVERIGNLNYPDEARRRRLGGDLLLVVGVRRDGSIAEMMLQRSSGEQVLDDAARRIVELAAPFAPFAGELADNVDILYIARTWEFRSDAGLSSR